MTTTPTAPKTTTLAIDGGTPVRTAPFPHRPLFGQQERAAAIALFDECIQRGGPYGYGGPHEAAYCDKFAQMLGGGFADGVNSGTNALFVALRTLELEPFTEVIVPPISDPGGVMPVAMANLVPVVADSAPQSFNIGAAGIEAAITPRTSAIVVAHISGTPCDMNAIQQTARKHGLPIVEDCAQSHGATYCGRPAGTLGTIAAFSTMFGKHHATGGQGGVVYTHDEHLAARMKRHADRGKPIGLDEKTNVVAALNCNMDEMHAAIGVAQLDKLPQIVARRRAFAKLVIDGCRDLKAVKVDTGTPGAESSYWFMLLHLDPGKLRVSKDQFAAAVKAEGVEATGFYTHVTCDHAWFKQRKVFGTSGLPWSAPQYQGDRNPSPQLPNIRAAVANMFRINMHEFCDEQYARDLVAALAKVEKAYLR
jgi:dTDP-4-amino-4,6-dideoxygalactose transaminase